MKKCSKCKEEKELTEFHKQNGGKFGLSSKCKICKGEEGLNWYNNNLEKAKLQNKEWLNNNKEKYNYHHKQRYKNDIIYKLKKNIRTSLWQHLKSSKQYNKFKSSIKLLGCKLEEYKQYLESQFKPEMNWNNHGEVWEIDHIIPCDNFDLTILEEQEKCFHYTNLQPLFKTTKIAEQYGYKEEGNRNKSNKKYNYY